MPVSLVPRSGRVAVIGAGISGLSYSFFLSKLRPDLHITIFEARSEPGGWIQTVKLKDGVSDILLEKGPRTLRGVSDGTLVIVDMLRQLGRESEIEVMRSTSMGNRKWLLDPSNQLVQVPNSLLSFIKFLSNDVTQGLIPSILREPFLQSKSNDNDESIRSFVTRRFGSPSLADNILSAMMHGIYSGAVDKLSMNATLPGMANLERQHGSILKAMIKSKKKDIKNINPLLSKYECLINPKANLADVATKLRQFPIMRLHNGLQVLPQSLSEYMKSQPNITLKFNSALDRLDVDSTRVYANGLNAEFDHIRFTSGFKALSQVTQVADADFNGFDYSTIFLVNVFTKKRGLIPYHGNGFGFLVPSRNTNPESLLGVIYDSDTESDAERFSDGQKLGKVPYEKITLMIGGHYFTSRGMPSIKANLKATKKVLRNILQVDLDKYNIIVRDEANESNKQIHLADNDLLLSYNLHQDCIPQYNVGYMKKADDIKRLVTEQSAGRISLGGPSLGKLGVPDCIMGELEAALDLSVNEQ